VVSFREYSKEIPSSIISQANGRCSSWRVVQYSIRDYSELTWVYIKDTSCITCKCWPNSMWIKKYVSFTTVFIILSTPCIMAIMLNERYLGLSPSGPDTPRLQNRPSVPWPSCYICFTLIRF
jgi:hypothetical protein